MHRIIGSSLDKVCGEILTHRRDALVALAEELMVVESIDSQDLQRIIEENSPSPRVVPGTAETAKKSAPVKEKDLGELGEELGAATR